MSLFELLSNPDLDAPVLVIGLEGWIDAGYGAAAALTTISDHIEMATVATFDTDVLLDHRARRPIVHLQEGMNTGLTWPVIELRACTDRDGHDVLFLVGAEPDHTWRAFSHAVVDLALEFGVRLVTGFGAYPAPVPHTRPTSVVATATNRELADLVGFVPGRIDVPAGVAAAIERRAADVGLPAVGLWAQVPHYASAMPYPAAAAALIEALAPVAGLDFGTGTLLDDATGARARLDELVANSPEHLDLVHQLEQSVDRVDRGDLTEMSGDDIAAEFEKFLRDQGS